MNDSLKKIKATLETSTLLSGKDAIKLIQPKEAKKEALRQTETNYAPKQAGRDWWWCDDV
jgi:hypothetical protein